MKPILVFLFSLTCFIGKSQTWISLAKSEIYQCTPTNQFSIDPYTNDIWVVSDSKASTINSNGQVYQFGTNELGSLWAGDNLCFGFSPGHVYYSKLLEGLYSFDSYNRFLEFSSTEIGSITTNGDTVYTLSGTQNMFKYTPSSTIDAMYGLSKVKAKNEFMYFNSGVIGRKVGTTSVYLHTDPQYIVAPINDFKFSRKSDTLYVAHTKGINFAYNYDFLDTITINNTFSMPSPNVLEIEFDHQDSLWAVFGDASNNPIAIAKLSGDTWINQIDNSNSPIDFGNFLGLEIDTLGNIWVADVNNIHTILSSTSPTWLGMENLSTESIELFPIPVVDNVTLRNCHLFSDFKIIDVNGKILKTGVIFEDELNIDLHDLSSQTYFLILKGSKYQISRKMVKL